MNGKISLVLLTMFVLIFSGFFYFNHTFSNISEDKFYSQKFDLSKKKILVYGSSHFVQLNSTHIKEKIENNSNNYLFFNMAENGDTPKRRSLNVENDLGIDPKIVVYGIGFRDFNIQKNDKLSSEMKLTDIIPWDTTELETLNPKLTTLEVLRAIVIDIITKDKESNVPYPNTSVFSQRIQEPISNENELQNSNPSGKISISIDKNEQVEYFKSIIKKLEENDVKVIIISTPYHKIALEEISEKDKKNFHSILLNIENEFDVKVVDLTEKFSELEIWRDTSHVAYNEKSIIFSESIAEIIIEEIIE